MESVYIDFVTKMLHPPSLSNCTENFLRGHTGPDWPFRAATGREQTYISQLEEPLQSCGTINITEQMHSHTQTHTEGETMLFSMETSLCCCKDCCILYVTHDTDPDHSYSVSKHTEIPY